MNCFPFCSGRGLRAGRRVILSAAVAVTLGAPALRAELTTPWLVSDTSAWYPFAATSTSEPGEIGVADWLDKPAGRHGRVTRSGAALIYNGNPIKFWGINLGATDAALTPAKVDEVVAHFAKYGVNLVRFHKFLEHWSLLRPGSGPHNFWLLDESAGGGMERFDYFAWKLKEAGIYLNFSASWHITISEGDKADIPYWQEFASSYGTVSHPNRPYVSTNITSTSIPAFIYFLEEFQELKIRQVENLLNHVNVHTGVKYAAEPAVAFVEMHNETSIGWVNEYLKNGWLTTLRSRATTQFCDWLRAKYGTHAALVQAWGTTALTMGATVTDNTNTAWPETGFPNQNLDANNIPPWVPNPNQVKNAAYRQRCVDTHAFLYEVQRDYYQAFRTRLRATGYQGELIASNWTWSSQEPHYLNLATDRDIGILDRHEYSGFNAESMLQVPGGEQLSKASNVQVSDRPFMFSEWAQSWENPNGVESRFINAAYGMGLQGWDAMTFFPGESHAAVNTAPINSLMQFKNQYFNPAVLPAVPFLVRQIRRGDVAEGTVVAERPVHLDSLIDGATLPFADVPADVGSQATMESTTFSGSSVLIPRRAPVVAKTQVRFTSSPQTAQSFDLAPYTETSGANTIYHATNGQLAWREGDGTHDADMIVNTPATQGAVGFFTQNEVIDLPDVEITILERNQFAAIYVTAAEPDRTLANSDSILVLALGRARNTGMTYDADGKVTNAGTAPVLMEPVQASIRFKRGGTISAMRLDHDGRPGAAVTIDQSQRRLRVNGQTHQTPYYRVTIEGANLLVDGGFDGSLTGVTSWAFSTNAAHVGTGWLAQGSGSKWTIDAQDRASANNSGSVPGMVQIIRDNRATTGMRTLSFEAGNSHSNQTLRVGVWGVNQDFRINLWDTNGPRDLNSTSVYLGTSLLADNQLGSQVMAWPSPVIYEDINFGSGYDYIVIQFFTSGVDTTQGRSQFIDNVNLGGGASAPPPPAPGEVEEPFDWAAPLTTTLSGGTATGAGGLVWAYGNAAEDPAKTITGTTLILGRLTAYGSGWLQTTLPAAYASGSVDIKPRFSGKAQVRVLVNGSVVATSPILDGHTDQRTFTFPLNAPAGAVLRLETTGQTTLDWKDCLVDNLRLLPN